MLILQQRGLAGGQHHHRTNLDKYHPGYFGKVGMRHFHLLRNHDWKPVVNIDKVGKLFIVLVKSPLTENSSSLSSLKSTARSTQSQNRPPRPLPSSTSSTTVTQNCSAKAASRSQSLSALVTSALKLRRRSKRLAALSNWLHKGVCITKGRAYH